MMDVKRDIPAGAPGADLEAQARAWIARLKSGSATEHDLRAFAGWRAASPAAEAAFDRARRMWANLGPALQADADARIVPLRRPALSRRVFLGGGGAAIAAAASGVVYLGARPEPTTTATETLFATAKGERRRVVIGDGAVAELNTATRARVWSGAEGQGLELLRGEVLVTLARAGADDRFVARIGKTVAMARAAQFLMRREGDVASLLCMQGQVLVEEAGQMFTLEPSALFSIDANGPRVAQAGPAAEVTAWRTGQLVYQDRPLGEVVEELNRYRKGRIILRDDRLASRRVSGVVHLDRIDGALTNFSRSLDTRITRLPGDIVILG